MRRGCRLIGLCGCTVHEAGAAAALLIVVSGGCLSPERPDPPAREVDLSHHFEGIDPADATFVLHDTRTRETVRFNAARAAERLPPGSTFKIANTLIALETGIADGPDFTLEWDGTTPDDGSFWAASWSRDHTLRSALAHSVLWYYQELARRIGPRRMQDHLDRFDYGNRETGSEPDRFWLNGDLRISADEQVDFLRRLHDGTLDVSARSREVVQELLVLDEWDGVRVRGKTGTVDVTPTRELAWLVGTLEADGHTWIFALNMEGEEVWERWGPQASRLALLRGLLHDVEGTLPPPG